MDCMWKKREAQHLILDRLVKLVNLFAFSASGEVNVYDSSSEAGLGFYFLMIFFFFKVGNAAGIAPLNPWLCQEERTGPSISTGHGGIDQEQRFSDLLLICSF